MDILTSTDIRVLQALTAGAAAYFLISRLSPIWQSRTILQPDLPLLDAAKNVTKPAFAPTRSIITQLQQTGKRCTIFYGSQTGTAEKFAYSLARELQGIYKLGCLVADLDDYDYSDIVKLSEGHLTVFILATYGEGEPTDNAISFKDFLDSKVKATRLEKFYYAGFGLGSSAYTQYNAMIHRVDERLASCGAQRIGALGLGDDGKSTLEEDFGYWTQINLPAIAKHFNLTEVPFVYEPAFLVTENFGALANNQRHVFRGEPNKGHLYGRVQGPFTSQNPYPATLTDARNISQSQDREYIQMDFDISGTSITYDTGDHVAVWPVNADREVDLFLRVFGLMSKQNLIVDITPKEAHTKMHVPPKTTYETLIRYHLEIGALVTRQMLRKLSLYATTDVTGLQMVQLAEDKERFNKTVSSRQLTIGQLLSELNGSKRDRATIDAPFSLIIEILPKLRPRRYSISSSSLTSRKSISITAVVDHTEDVAKNISFRGVSTNYFAALRRELDSSASGPTTHKLLTKRQIEQGLTAARPLIHVQRSKFRPPFDPSIPIVMIGPGTGVAPFRAFVQERAYQHSQGRSIGRTILFFGCRDSTKDFIYKEEWDNLIENDRLGDGVFQMYTAFSRQPGTKKQYVQDLIVRSQQSGEIRDLVLNQSAHIYICGNAARMAKDVTRAMELVLTENDNGIEVVAQLKKAGRWSEDVW